MAPTSIVLRPKWIETSNVVMLTSEINNGQPPSTSLTNKLPETPYSETGSLHRLPLLSKPWFPKRKTASSFSYSILCPRASASWRKLSNHQLPATVRRQPESQMPLPDKSLVLFFVVSCHFLSTVNTPSSSSPHTNTSLKPVKYSSRVTGW